MTSRKTCNTTARDQAPSGFSPALQRLCELTAGLSAALVDSEGETVDYAGVIDPYETKIAAAEWALVVRALRAGRALDQRDTSEIYFRGKTKSFAVILLAQDYALVVEMPAGSLFPSRRAVIQAVFDVTAEASLTLSKAWRAVRERWTHVAVQLESHTRRPAAIFRGGQWQPVQVLGRMTPEQLGPAELGYRIRLPEGEELTLVREPFNRWYADDELDVLSPGPRTIEKHPSEE